MKFCVTYSHCIIYRLLYFHSNVLSSDFGQIQPVISCIDRLHLTKYYVENNKNFSQSCLILCTEIKYVLCRLVVNFAILWNSFHRSPIFEKHTTMTSLLAYLYIFLFLCLNFLEGPVEIDNLIFILYPDSNFVFFLNTIFTFLNRVYIR